MSDFARNMFLPYVEMLRDIFHEGLVVNLNTEEKQLILDDALGGEFS